ncbi:MAG TPA: ATP-binding protein [Jatrophihabitantaceae bacterium]|jgi:two-component system NarL family sensor kinase
MTLSTAALGPPTAAERGRWTPADLVANPELFAILVRHAYRAVRVQFVLRIVLLVFMALAISLVPPARELTSSVIIVVSYGVWTVGLALWTRGGGIAPIRWMWVALVVDALALTLLTVIAGESNHLTWTADLLVNGFFIIPFLAATQLRPLVCAAVAGVAVVAYFVASASAKSANTEPWDSIILRTFVLFGIGVGCVGLSRVQLSRVSNIAQMMQNRSALLDELVGIETRERRSLAEHLHDGALQYVLAARQDLADARDGDATAFDRIERALTESSGLLRETVTQLHPAVLRQAGLARALRDLTTSVGARAGLTVDLDVSDWPDEPGSADELLYGCARELLTNVAKHARAKTARVVLDRADGTGTLVVADDGVGLPVDALDTRLAEGHIGLASLRTRVAAAAGQLTISDNAPGTTVTIVLPVA